MRKTIWIAGVVIATLILAVVVVVVTLSGGGKPVETVASSTVPGSSNGAQPAQALPAPSIAPRAMPGITFKGKVVDAETGEPVKILNVRMGTAEAQRDGTAEAIFWQPDMASARRMFSIEGAAFSAKVDRHDGFYAIRVEAAGYLPGDSPVLPTDGKDVEQVFRMVKGSDVAGTLMGVDGKALADTAVWLVTAGVGRQPLQIRDGTIGRQAFEFPKSVTDKEGKFSFMAQKEDYALVAVDEHGQGIVQRVEFEKSKTLTLQKWARIEGVVKNGDKPLPTVVVVNYPHTGGISGSPAIWNVDAMPTDGEGKFIFAHVAVGATSVSRRAENRQGNLISYALSDTTPAIVEPGETIHIEVNDVQAGMRILTGTIVIPESLQGNAQLMLRGVLAPEQIDTTPVMPVEVMEMTFEQQQEWWKKQPEGRGNRGRGDVPRHLPTMSTDGELRITAVPVGRYTFWVNGEIPVNRLMTRAAVGAVDVEVPAAAKGGWGVPVDLKEIKLELVPIAKLGIGDDASALVVTSVEGKEIRIADYKGKYVVMNLWQAGPKDRLPEREVLSALWEEYGKAGKIGMVGVMAAVRVDELKAYQAARPMAWPQATMGKGAAEVRASSFLGQFQGAGNYLIGPDGKFLGMKMKGEEIKAAVEKVLGK